MLLRGLLLVLASGMTLGSALPAAQTQQLFSFHSNSWLNLHHFIRAAARGGPPPTAPSEDERRIWSGGVEFYRPYATRDLLRDQGMVAIKNALREAEGRTTLDTIMVDADLKAALGRVMPVYQKYWWQEHDRAAHEWVEAAAPLLERHGVTLSQAVARTYDVTWPSYPLPVDLSAVAGPGGAYTTCDPTHVTISSQDPSYRGYAALEMLFHESSHCVSNLFQRVNRTAVQQKVSVPPQLWHAVLFYTAGELTRRELSAHGIGYTEYASSTIYMDLCGAGCREKIVEHWTPHLDGKRTVDEALSALVLSFR